MAKAPLRLVELGTRLIRKYHKLYISSQEAVAKKGGIELFGAELVVDNDEAAMNPLCVEGHIFEHKDPIERCIGSLSVGCNRVAIAADN